MDTPVIDMHSHVGNQAANGWVDAPDTYIRILDTAGVDRALVSCLFYGDVSRCNDVTAAFVARHPDRFMGVAFVTPYYPEEAIAELERAFKRKLRAARTIQCSARRRSARRYARRRDARRLPWSRSTHARPCLNLSE